jgi:hypothetical protein
MPAEPAEGAAARRLHGERQPVEQPQAASSRRALKLPSFAFGDIPPPARGTGGQSIRSGASLGRGGAAERNAEFL